MDEKKIIAGLTQLYARDLNHPVSAGHLIAILSDSLGEAPKGKGLRTIGRTPSTTKVRGGAK